MARKYPSCEDARRVLRKYWGYDDFRPGQWDIIQPIVEGRDVLAVLPTGGGKSICYQVPALLYEGLTLVISPLIALMQDQVAALNAHGVKAAYINSALSFREIEQRWIAAEQGVYRLLYLAPERLASEKFVARASRLNISLLAVDEAHCISEWGHNFRPSYLQIAAAREHMGNPPTIAVTATATPHVRKDIVEQLALRQPERIIRGFDRSNIVWSVFRTENKRTKALDVLEGVSGPGILYSSTRKGVERWAAWLARRNVSVASYHGGMAGSVRERMQTGWVRGDQRIMVATNAFGMGIDKPNVRFVVHVDLPGTLEGYYQEAGRGGRDGKTSFAALLYHPGDEDTPRRLIDESHPAPKEMQKVYDAVCSLGQVAVAAEADAPLPLQIDAVRRLTGLAAGKIHTAATLLERQDAWKILPQRDHAGLIRCRRDVAAFREYAKENDQTSFGAFVEALLRALDAGAFSDWREIDVRTLARRTGLARERLLKGLEYLQQREWLDWIPPDRAMRVALTQARSARFPIDGERVQAARKRAEAQLDQMIRFARSTTCRRHFLLTYFGEAAPDRCGTCDVCLGRHEAYQPPSPDAPIVRQLLGEIAEGAPRRAWLEGTRTPAYRVDQLVSWLMNEGYLRAPRPLGGALELTTKATALLSSS